MRGDVSPPAPVRRGSVEKLSATKRLSAATAKSEKERGEKESLTTMEGLERSPSAVDVVGGVGMTTSTVKKKKKRRATTTATTGTAGAAAKQAQDEADLAGDDCGTGFPSEKSGGVASEGGIAKEKITPFDGFDGAAKAKATQNINNYSDYEVWILRSLVVVCMSVAIKLGLRDCSPC